MGSFCKMGSLFSQKMGSNLTIGSFSVKTTRKLKLPKQINASPNIQVFVNRIILTRFSFFDRFVHVYDILGIVLFFHVCYNDFSILRNCAGLCPFISVNFLVKKEGEL